MAAPHSSPTEVSAPPLRRVAVAAYSASTTQLDTLLSGQPLGGMRNSVAVWGVSDSVRSAAFTAQRQETWCLDLLTGSTTVAAATFEAISRTG
jgi:hypothetical protein